MRNTLRCCWNACNSDSGLSDPSRTVLLLKNNRFPAWGGAGGQGMNRYRYSASEPRVILLLGSFGNRVYASILPLTPVFSLFAFYLVVVFLLLSRKDF